MFFAVGLAAFCCSLSAQNVTEEHDPIQGNFTKLVSTFYGTKASKNANNPCKGATTRKCGKIETELQSVSADETLVRETLKSPDDKILSVSTRIELKPIDEVKEEILRRSMEQMEE